MLPFVNLMAMYPLASYTSILVAQTYSPLFHEHLADTLDTRTRILAAQAATADGAQLKLAESVAGPDLVRAGPVLSVDDAHVLAGLAGDATAGGRAIANDGGRGEGHGGKEGEASGELHFGGGLIVCWWFEGEVCCARESFAGCEESKCVVAW